MKIYILTDETTTASGKTSNYEIVDVFTDPAKAIKSFNYYLDEVELIWRTEGKPVSKNWTFNRYSEPTDEVLCSASVGAYTVSVLIFDTV